MKPLNDPIKGSESTCSQIYTVKGRAVRKHQVRLDMESGESIMTRRFVPVSPGATLTRTQSTLLVRLNDGTDLQVSPAWKESMSFQVGDVEIPIEIKEIETEIELDGFFRLTRYHYRGAKGAGRTVPLVVTTSRDDLPHVLGFIELATSFLVNSPRKMILDTAFADAERGVGWLRWDGATSKKWINCIARISRCVVFPEFRGLGLSSLLVESAVKYARDRWHMSGIRPVFLEITADMLRYWPFVQKAGFVYVGDTEGNGHRAARDMRYLIRKAAATSGRGQDGMPRGGGGILSLQRSRAEHLRAVVQSTGLSLENVIDHLRTSPDKLSDDEWVLLHTAYRRPKPTYLLGLTNAAQSFLLKRAALATSKLDNGISKRDSARISEGERLLDVGGLTISVQAKPVSSRRSRRVQEAFGIVSKEIDLPVIENLDLAVHRGEIILVTGPSGSGKSLLLEAIQALARNSTSLGNSPDVIVDGLVKGDFPSVGGPRACHPDIAPVDALETLPLEGTLELMAVAGLAEPQVLIRPAKTLSLGQRYRLSLALGMSDETDVFLVDEFCEALDQFSAVAVAKHLRREVSLRAIGAVVATSRPAPLMSSLQPDRIVVLSSDGRFVWR